MNRANSLLSQPSRPSRNWLQNYSANAPDEDLTDRKPLRPVSFDLLSMECREKGASVTTTSDISNASTEAGFPTSEMVED